MSSTLWKIIFKVSVITFLLVFNDFDYILLTTKVKFYSPEKSFTNNVFAGTYNKKRKRYKKRYYSRRYRRIPRKSYRRAYMGNPQAIILGPSLSFPDKEGAYVWWHDRYIEGYHAVEYGTTKEMPFMITSNDNTRYPFLKLKDLVPGMTYYYRIHSGELRSAVYSFRTHKYNPHFRIGIWADNQHGNRIFNKYSIPVLLEQNPTFLIAVGDLVQNGDDYSQWHDQLYAPAYRMLSSIPWYPVRGNHDGEQELAKKMVPFPGRHYYTFSLGPLFCIVLDTNLDYSPGSEQSLWLVKQLKSKEWRGSSFRMIALHYPPYTNLFDISQYYHGKFIREYLVPLFENYGANIVISGHAHCYTHAVRNTPHGKIHYFVVGGGGGRLDTKLIDSWPFIVKSVIAYHIAIAEVTGNSFDFSVIDTLTRESIDRVVIKGKPISN